MNPKIKKLATNSGMEDYPVRGVYCLYGEKDIEDFALAIIKKCSELGDKALQDGEWPADVISKHFGVKE